MLIVFCTIEDELNLVPDKYMENLKQASGEI